MEFTDMPLFKDSIPLTNASAPKSAGEQDYINEENTNLPKPENARE
jgi:hypothetical protein